MARTITGHALTASERLVISVTDEPGPGGANHRYEVAGYNALNNPSFLASHVHIDPGTRLLILFQNGPIGESGVNGVTQEVLLEVVADRLRSFQAGEYACRENAMALQHIEEAMHWLQHRTIARMRRGVEGTSAV